MYKVPISGGPHTGKTTLLEALKVEFPNAYFVPEPATEVIKHELSLEAAHKSYVPKVPWIDYTKFAPLVLAKSVELEADMPEDADIVFQDRSLIDTIAYARLNKVFSIISYTEKLAGEAGYTAALLCEPVGDYLANEVRRETVEEARLTHQYLADAYAKSGLRVIHLPAVSVEERIAIVHQSLPTEF